MTDPKKRPKLENFFSQLPRDCNLSAFRLVNRKTLNELECVSKEVREISSDPSLSRIKTRGSLYIKELPEGNRNFQFTNWPSLLAYEIKKGLRKGKRSLRSESLSGFPLTACCCYPQPYRPQQIPNHMLEALSDLAKKHAFDKIHCQAIYIDNNFIDKLQPLLNGSVKLHFEYVHLDKSLDFQKFANFLLSAKSNSIEFDFPRIPNDVDFDAAFLGIFDEQFWTTNADGALDFWLQYRGPIGPYHWIASRNFMPVLCRFRKFMLRSMKMHPSHVVEFIQMRLDTLNSYSELHFSITEDLTDVHLSKVDSKKYEVSRERIQKIGTPNGCTIKISDDSGRSRIDLCFYQRKTDNS